MKSICETEKNKGRRQKREGRKYRKSTCFDSIQHNLSVLKSTYLTGGQFARCLEKYREKEKSEGRSTIKSTLFNSIQHNPCLEVDPSKTRMVPIIIVLLFFLLTLLHISAFNSIKHKPRLFLVWTYTVLSPSHTCIKNKRRSSYD